MTMEKRGNEEKPLLFLPEEELVFPLDFELGVTADEEVTGSSSGTWRRKIRKRERGRE